MKQLKVQSNHDISKHAINIPLLGKRIRQWDNLQKADPITFRHICKFIVQVMAPHVNKDAINYPHLYPRLTIPQI